MSTDGDALRQAILAQPDDDVLRLVYADWLEENGQSDRGAFIRAQVWAAQTEPYSPDARRHAATYRRLLKTHREEWIRPLGQRVAGGSFVRGFVEHAQVNAATFPQHAADLFALEPIRSLHLVRYAPVAGPHASLLPFFQTPQLERVTRLDLNNLHLSPVELEPIAESPNLRALTDLGLRGRPVLPDWLTTLLTGPALPALAGLDLADLSHLGPCLADTLPRVERRFLRLNLNRVTFTSEQIQRALGSRCLREVEELHLEWMTGSGRDGALTHLDLGWVIPWNRLRLLDLNSQGIGDDGVTEIVRELTRRREPAPLRWLGLAHNHIAADGVRALVRSDPAKINLFHLDMTGNNLTLSQRAALTTRFPEAQIV